MHEGSLPRTTGIPSLITGAWEDYITSLNKPVEKPKVIKVMKGGKGKFICFHFSLLVTLTLLQEKPTQKQLKEKNMN